MEKSDRFATRQEVGEEVCECRAGRLIAESRFNTEAYDGHTGSEPSDEKRPG